VVEDDDLSPARLAALASEVLGDPGRLERMSEASRALARPDAAERIADEILAAVGT
jgi:UDP-N-acetylglucosamine--N-acetylmuramyl-(pentapeptide) pyrophosphoryl-undecaprenol N-acetylglucosamine transferase